MFDASVASAAAAVQQSLPDSQQPSRAQEVPQAAQRAQYAVAEEGRRLQGRPQPLRAVRPSTAALSPLSERQAAQQQQWRQQQELARQAGPLRAPLQPFPHAPQSEHPWHTDTQPWQQEQRQHAGNPQFPPADGHPHGSPSAQQQGQPPSWQQQLATGAAPKGPFTTRCEDEPQLSQPNAADLEAYEQAASMLRQLHFERLQRCPPQPVAIAADPHLWHHRSHT